ncbi:uncharacterized protein RAG0_14392 [Rhynchosporium agropyri]|uniref:Uncharacterized protein n=1 Tax=Rhynchosporium agropyri TaxID=914238 RepID=A0A1E1LGU0_9HELO|nr:uncharacterized protein RAG0_14392 [Rhynchosporium agropyri]
MLPQKTSWRIKNFISPKNSSSKEKSGKLSDDSRKTESTTSAPKRLSWLSQTSSSDSPTLRRATSNATRRSSPLTQLDSTAHSSSSSLCSCECEIHPAPIDHALFRVEPPPPLPEILYLPPLSPEDASPDSKKWRLIFQEPLSRPLTPDELRIGTTTSLTPALGIFSTFDVIVNIPPTSMIDDDKTPTQSFRCTGEFDMEYLSENVEQLIQDADRAFQAVGAAIADAKAATSEWYEPSRPVTQRPTSISRSILKGSSQLPLRSLSISKGKKRPVKKKMFSRSIPKSPPPPINTPARWTLTDVTANMAEVFSGKLFRREVDEMLTPNRIQQMKDDKAESVRKTSLESIHSFETDGSTPTDPFHLESLSSRIITARQDSPPLSSPVLPPPATPQASPRNSLKIPPPRPPRPEDTLSLPLLKAGMVFNKLSFPAPPIPPRAVHRPSASRRASLLPTILEVSPLDLTPAQFSNFKSGSNHSSSRPAPTIFPPPTQVFVPSTNFTLIAPLFRQGPIRLARIPRDRRGSSPEGEVLDWIAFQMAIAGTIELDEHFGDLRDDAQWESDEAETDDIVDWWASYGYRGYGRIENEADVRERDGLAPLISPAADIQLEGIAKDNSEYQQKRTWKTWTDTPPPPIPPARVYINVSPTKGLEHNIDMAEISEILPGPSNVPSLLLISSPPNTSTSPRRPSSAESVLSLPPSSMLDLVVSRKLGDGDEVSIPMGFNLGHDLGDFLNWETSHVQSLYLERWMA